MMTTLADSVFAYHERPRPGKVEIVPTKSTYTPTDLSMAYTPGVADVAQAIARDPELAYRYTAKGNLVAVVSNGSAVLGLGSLGPMAAKPVMEGKAVLFKRFADIDAFDIELAAAHPEEVIRIVKALEPTFGGINLEDIKAPECFEIEEALRHEMQIPVFHGDQHGTAIVVGAALLNALEVVNKRFAQVRVVICGAGAAGLACAEMGLDLGGRRDQLRLVDSGGVVYAGRPTGLNSYKRRFAVETKDRTLADAVRGADVFIGLSTRDILTPEMLGSMANRPVVFALANADPEIRYELALETRTDVVLATGRSDYPNQVNNALVLPSIFRGALDVRATTINRAMELAAARALAALAKEPVPGGLLTSHGLPDLSFGPRYLIPSVFDPRVVLRIAPAVAAMTGGVARRPIEDPDRYGSALAERMATRWPHVRLTQPGARVRESRM